MKTVRSKLFPNLAIVETAGITSAESRIGHEYQSEITTEDEADAMIRNKGHSGTKNEADTKGQGKNMAKVVPKLVIGNHKLLNGHGGLYSGPAGCRPKGCGELHCFQWVQIHSGMPFSSCGLYCGREWPHLGRKIGTGRTLDFVGE